MQTLVRDFLAIYLSSLLADFVFQPHRLGRNKNGAAIPPPTCFTASSLPSAALIASFVLRGIPSSRHARNWSSVALTLVHLRSTSQKYAWTEGYPAFGGSWLTLAISSVHLLTVGVAAWLLSPPVPLSELRHALQTRGPFRIGFWPGRSSTWE